MSSMPPSEGKLIAEGMYSYTVDDRSRAAEVWRLYRLDDDRLHMQTLLGVGQQILYGMDLRTSPDGTSSELMARLHDQGSERLVRLAYEPGHVQGAVQDTNGQHAIDLTVPAAALLFPAAIATRFSLGRSLDLSTENEQSHALVVVPVLDAPHKPALQPYVVQAQATVLGPEAVDLLMATVTASHVLIEWPDHPPQHAWLDERRFPIQWSWVEQDAHGVSATHTYSLTRYAWL